MSIDQFSQYLEIATFIITIIGVPFGIYSFLKEQRLQREEREYGTFDALDNKYIELQQLCLEYPSLDIFDSPRQAPKKLTEEEEKQEEAILLIRISIFERAFLMYNREAEPVRKEQWSGWEMEIVEWFDRANFAKIWREHSPYYDQRFVSYFNDKTGFSVEPDINT